MDARVTAEHRGQWMVTIDGAERPAVVAGALRDAIARGEADRPAVGDWVALRPVAGDADALVIEAVHPRRTKVARKAAGRALKEQVVAANVDVVFVVCAMGRDVNPHRIERFVALARGGGALPVLVLNKADTVDDPAPYVQRAAAVAPGVEVHVVSAHTGAGFEGLEAHLGPGRTAALLGTSGAGKSTIVNRWLGAEAVATGEMGAAGKGRHTTTGRQLLTLASGAAVIDTPGLREVGLIGGDEGVTVAFDDVTAVAEGCRFTDCAHAGEPGCAVAEAVRGGTLDEARVEAWRRLHREQEHAAEGMDAAARHRRRRTERMGSKALRARLRDKRR